MFGVTSAWAEEMLDVSSSHCSNDGTPLIVADLATAELVEEWRPIPSSATKISFYQRDG